MKRNRLVMLAVAAGVVVAIVAVLFITCTTDQRDATVRPPATPTAAPPLARDWFQIFFTTPQPKARPSPSGSPGRLDERLVAAIDAARISIDMAIYDLDLDNLADALVRAHGRGVRVRLVTDTDNAKLPQVERVRKAGIPVIDDQRGPIMHHKFVVLDGEAVWTGSWNFTTKDTFNYNNNAALIRSRDLAANYASEFDKMFTGRRFGPTKPKDVPHPTTSIDGVAIETVFESEGDAPPRIIERLRGARDSITFLAFVFTDDTIGNAIQERFAAGVAVRGVVETVQSQRQEGELNRFRAAGLDAAQPPGRPSSGCVAGPGVLPDANPYLMHHKVIVIDGRTVIFGSYNFSRNAAQDNDENLLIVDDAAVAGAYLDEFCRIYNAAVEKAAKK